MCDLKTNDLVNCVPNATVQPFGAFMDPKQSVAPVAYQKTQNHSESLTFELPGPRRQVDQPYPYPTGINTNPSCSVMYNTAQQMPGVVCSKVNNNNSARGNEFGLPYNPTKPFNSPEYNNESNTAETPNRAQLDKQVRFSDTVYVVDERSQFYPLPHFQDRQNPYYKTHPEFRQYKDGRPYYKFNQPTGVVEGFVPAGTKMTHFFVIMLMLILVFFIVFTLI